MEKLISFISVSIFLITIFYGEFLYKRLNRPGYIRIMRIICWLVSIASLLFFIITILQSSRLLDSFIYHASISYRDMFRFVVSWLLVIFMLMGFRKFWLYYIRYDEKTILTNWYIKEQFSLVGKEKYDDACKYLQKAVEISPDSVAIWCILAYFNEYFLNTPAQCDQYLAKARQIIGSSDQPTARDKANLEHYTGLVLQFRGDLQAGLECLKRAYDLDPTPYRKKEYESALKKTQEAQDKTGS